MTEQQRLLLSLIKVGLGGEIEEGLKERITNYKGLFTLASEQTVRGIVMDALLSLNLGKNDDRATLFEWYSWVMELEKRNKTLNQDAAEAYMLFKDSNLHPVMAKGQVVAMEYPKPEHRECGDVDLYFNEDDGRKAVERVKSWIVYKPANKTLRDYNFIYRSAKVEIHPFMVHSISPKKSKYSSKIHNWFVDELTNNYRVVKMGDKGLEVAVPSVLHNIIYEFYHIWMHCVKGGIGLRQICDWMMCLHNNYGKYDVAVLKVKLEEFYLMNQWVEFGNILVDYLGLPVEEMPFYKKSNNTEMLMDIIFKDGNFGHNNPNKAKSKFKPLLMLQKTAETLSRYFKLWRVFPIDAARFLPGFRALGKYFKI